VLNKYTPWLETAFEELGIEEWPGAEHNPRVLWYHAATDLNKRDRLTDEAAWCGSYTARMVLEAGFTPPQKAFRARNWMRWGEECKPVLGCVCVIKRRKKGSDKRTGSRGGYHVGFFLDFSRGGVVLLSGNASDRVGIDTYSKRSYDFLAFRTAA
jgi:uncharacterized protein (TIGR02594 family)